MAPTARPRCCGSPGIATRERPLLCRREEPSAEENDDRHHAAGASIGRFIRRFEADEVIFEAGTRGNAMYVVLSGQVHITRAGSSEILNDLGPGEFFGEMALVGDAIRRGTATARAAGTRLAEIDRARFVYLVAQRF